jgi:hypothetical protein
VNAEELLVHDSSKRKAAERLHASIVYPLGVFVLALEFEGKVVGQMPTFVVSSQEEEGLWIPDLERP